MLLFLFFLKQTSRAQENSFKDIFKNLTDPKRSILVSIHTTLLGLIACLDQYPKTKMQWVRFTCPVTCWLCSSVRCCLQSGPVSSAACSLHSGSQRSWSRRTEVQKEGRGTRHQDRSKPLAARWAQTQEEQSLCSEERDKTMRIRE